MADIKQDLGKLIVVHGIAPAYQQRAIFIVILSFLFFLGTMTVYYIRQNALYFILATAFLMLYLLTLFSFFMQRRSIVSVYEGGISYKKRAARWSEIDSVGDSGIIILSGEKPIVLPSAINDSEKLI